METMVDQIEIFDVDNQDAINIFLHELSVNIRAEIQHIKIRSSNILIHYAVPISELEVLEEN